MCINSNQNLSIVVDLIGSEMEVMQITNDESKIVPSYKFNKCDEALIKWVGKGETIPKVNATIPILFICSTHVRPNFKRGEILRLEVRKPRHSKT